MQYDQDDETRELLSVMTAHFDDESEPEPGSRYIVYNFVNETVQKLLNQNKNT